MIIELPRTALVTTNTSNFLVHQWRTLNLIISGLLNSKLRSGAAPIHVFRQIPLRIQPQSFRGIRCRTMPMGPCRSPATSTLLGAFGSLAERWPEIRIEYERAVAVDGAVSVGPTSVDVFSRLLHDTYHTQWTSYRLP